MREQRFGVSMLVGGFIVGIAFLGLIALLALKLGSFTPAPVPVGLLLIALFIYWMVKSEHDWWWRSKRDEPPTEGDRSPVSPHPPLLTASAQQAWPED